MTCMDLIIELSKLPPDEEVVYDMTQDGAEAFCLVVVDDIGEIITDNGTRLILLNPDEVGEERIDENKIN
jgi:hypothetical protein